MQDSSEGEVRGIRRTRQAGKEKEKGSVGKGEHEGKGGFAGEEERQSTKTMRNEEEEEQLGVHEDEKQKELRNEEEEEQRGTA